MMRILKVLWVAPNLNHYKTRFLKKLEARGELDVTVLAGAEMRALGHETLRDDVTGLKVIRVAVDKANFQKSMGVYSALVKRTKQDKPDVVLMPCEKKHLFVIMFLYALKVVFPFKLTTYTHPEMRSKDLKNRRLNRLMTKLMFAMYDSVIFYTEQAMKQAVSLGLLSESKAAYANNTLDTDSIKAVYEFKAPLEEPRILFIGRLIPSKRLDILFEVYRELKKRLPKLKLVVVGDGPEAPYVKSTVENVSDIEWKGAIVNERIIANIMCKVQVVFLPGHSGLSIVHAFCYGRPFATIADESHPPEIVYLKDGWNGLLLSGDRDRDVARLANLLCDREKLEKYARNAYDTGEVLSIENWCSRISDALLRTCAK